MSAISIGLAIGFGVIIAGVAIGAAVPDRSLRVGAIAAAASAVAVAAAAWASGAVSVVDVPWIGALGSRLTLALDALGAPLAVFATALAAPVLWYSAAYLPRHLEERGRPASEQARLNGLMLAFAAAMVLLLLARDLLIVFVALELTALVSFWLIEFDRHDPVARRAATVAVVVTVGGSLLFLVGALLLAVEAGTTVITELRDGVARRPVADVAGWCVFLGVIGKSAQVPLHFWLPRAMVAPTPVSSYLHSAALVAAGVFVLMRLRFLLQVAPGVLEALYAVGVASVVVGGALALVADELKRILAYSTIAQYGYASMMIALGGADGVAGAPLFIVAHGLCKAALFLTAGAVTHTTGVDRLSQTGGLGRRMPALAVASAVCAAGLAGLPLTIGYVKDELLFAAAAASGGAAAVVAAAGAAVTLAYTARLWLGLFAGRDRSGGASPPPWTMTGPVALLAAVVAIGGVWIAPWAAVFERAGQVVGGHPVSIDPGYHLELRAELWMALAAWAGGAALFASRRRWQRALAAVTGRAGRIGAARAADALARRAADASEALHNLEMRDLRDRIGTVLFATAVFVGLGVFGAGWPGGAGEVAWSDLPVIGALAVTAFAAIAAVQPSGHVAVVVMLSFVGFGLALTFALSGAPEVALVIVLVETTLTILFLAVLWQLGGDVVERARRRGERTARGPWTGVAAGAAAFLVAWYALERPRTDTVAWAHVRLADRAHAKDVVTAVLADFRGLDTAVELTVLAVAVLGAASITWGREP